MDLKLDLPPFYGQFYSRQFSLCAGLKPTLNIYVMVSVLSPVPARFRKVTTMLLNLYSKATIKIGWCYILEIELDHLTDERTIKLISAHLAGMAENSPPESIHALNVAGLKQAHVTFYSAWEGDEIMGCGALKELTPKHGEVKSMRTAEQHLRKGVARAILQHLINEAKKRGYTKLSLETGSMEAFLPARRLYENLGFTYCKPFDTYTDDPNSTFMTLEL